MSNKKRTKKKSSGDSMITRARAKAKTILEKSAHLIGYAGGMAYDGTIPVGLEYVVAGPAQGAFKTAVVAELQQRLTIHPRVWSLIICFVDENPSTEEISLKVRTKVFRNVTPFDLDRAGTDRLHELSKELWGDDTFGSFWMTIPSEISDGEAVIKEMEDELEATGVFDPIHTREMVAKRKELATIEESFSPNKDLNKCARSIRSALLLKNIHANIRLSDCERQGSNMPKFRKLAWAMGLSHNAILVSYNLGKEWDLTGELLSDEKIALMMEVASPFIDELLEANAPEVSNIDQVKASTEATLRAAALSDKVYRSGKGHRQVRKLTNSKVES